MRYRLGLMLVIAVIVLCVLCGVAVAETRCRVGGQYRFVGPSVVGDLKFTETGLDGVFSVGTVFVILASKQFCPTCPQMENTYLIGDYWSGPGDQTCGVSVTVHHRDDSGDRSGYLSGTLAFAGAVIIFNGYDSSRLRPGVDINLTFALRTDSFFKP